MSAGTIIALITAVTALIGAVTGMLTAVHAHGRINKIQAQQGQAQNAPPAAP